MQTEKVVAGEYNLPFFAMEEEYQISPEREITRLCGVRSAENISEYLEELFTLFEV